MRVSIVVDNYNSERFVGEAIESALAQTHADVEVLVVDDGSTDGSRGVIATYAESVRALYKENGGQASALNAGFAACSGDAVIFLDGDDTLAPTAAARAAAALADASVVKVHWVLDEIDGEGRRAGRRWPTRALPAGDLRDEVLRNGFADNASPPTSGNAFARGFLERVLPMPESFTIRADGYLVRLASVAGRVAAIDEPLGTWRIHGENATFWHSPIDQHRWLLDRYETMCRDAAALCGVPAGDIAAADERHAWMRRLDVVTRELPEVVPAGERMIVIDDDDWGAQWERPGMVAGRDAVPFLEREGTWWGRPDDDAQAIAELDRLHAGGARYVVVGWPAFWWLDHYRGLAAHLDDRGTCLLDNERVRVFELA